MKKIIKKSVKIIIVILVLALCAAGYYFVRRQNEKAIAERSGATPEALAEIRLYEYTEDYANPTYNFSFKYPKDFEVSSIPNGDQSEAILIQNVAKSIGIQILITSLLMDDVDVTADIVQASVPDLKVLEPKEITIGSSLTTRKGLSFTSDNSAFGGKSREVWFIYHGNLYQISTYYEIGRFLQDLLATFMLY